MVPFEIRAALHGDEEQLLFVARHLNSVNLPNDRDAIHEIVSVSNKSFTGEIKDPRLRQYVFVLVDRQKEQIIGTSMIVSQLGRRGAPYIYFDVFEEERYSATIDRHFYHTLLRIGYSYDGPTEIGGLVIMPEYRRASDRLGTFISYVRFLYLAAHRGLFQSEVLAELLPPLEPDGTSHLWEALGRRDPRDVDVGGGAEGDREGGSADARGGEAAAPDRVSLCGSSGGLVLEESG
jgi:arginine N-succinyltransferase